MAASSLSLSFSPVFLVSSPSKSLPPPPFFPLQSPSSSPSFCHLKTSSLLSQSLNPLNPKPQSFFVCRATAEYKFPDPIPEFADAETKKFKEHMLERLTRKKDYCGEFLGEVVDICTEIFSNFLHTEYGGPGTLLVIPFIDMADTLREKDLPGAAQAARAAVLWAQEHVDNDWKEWTGNEDSDSD